MLIVIFSIIAILSLVIVIIIVGRRFPQLAAIDLESLPNEKNIEVKAKIIEERLRRKIGGRLNRFFNLYFLPLWVKLRVKVKKIYLQTINLEKYYKQELKRKSAVSLAAGDKAELIEKKLAQAKECFEKEEYKEAEENYIEILSADAKNFAAYLGLAKIYLALRDFEHAKEIYNHLLKLDSRNDAALAGLADLAGRQNDWQSASEFYGKIIEVVKDNSNYFYDYAVALEKIGENKKALEAIQNAVKLKPNDPRCLDYLLEMSIINKKKYLAYKVFDQLKGVNPENQKLAEFKKRIEEL